MKERNSSKLRLDLIAGARPNFMKIAPVERALREIDMFDARIIHTGQHYDQMMNDVFFSELGIPEPAVHLKVGSGSHGQQTARILERYEKHLFIAPPAATIVFGDVNSTVACALAAVDMKNFTGHEPSAFEIEHGVRDVTDVAHAIDRMKPSEHIVIFRRVHRRFDHSRSHGIDANATLSVLDGQ